MQERPVLFGNGPEFKSQSLHLKKKKKHALVFPGPERQRRGRTLRLTDQATLAYLKIQEH